MEHGSLRILCAPDKFRGGATALDAASALAAGVRAAGPKAVIELAGGLSATLPALREAAFQCALLATGADGTVTS